MYLGATSVASKVAMLAPLMVVPTAATKAVLTAVLMAERKAGYSAELTDFPRAGCLVLMTAGSTGAHWVETKALMLAA